MKPRPKPNRLTSSNPQDKLRTFLVDSLTSGQSTYNFPFFLGQVVNSKDPLNANRIQVRIPLIDDVFYLNEENGLIEDDSLKDKELPWCISSNNRFINTPENNSIVLVALFNRDNPFSGRVWLTAFEELSNQSLFSKLGKESFDWNNAEDTIETAYDSTPGLRNKEGWKERSYDVNYKVGIRGKNKNKLLFDKDVTVLVQNEGLNNESKIELGDSMKLKSKSFEILSSLSNENFSPVFAEPLFNHLDRLESCINQILVTLISSPGVAAGTPVVANPVFGSIKTNLIQIKQDLAQLKLAGKGKSRYIKIN